MCQGEMVTEVSRSQKRKRIFRNKFSHLCKFFLLTDKEFDRGKVMSIFHK